MLSGDVTRKEKQKKYRRNGCHGDWSIVRKEEEKQCCLFCEGSDDSKDCSKAQELSLHNKQETLRNKKRCFLCLKPGHWSEYCKQGISSNICSKRHYTIWCVPMSGRATEESSLWENDRRRAGCFIINSVLFGVDPEEHFGKFESKREEADRDNHYH